MAAESHREDVARLDLQTIVGSRLREQRLARGTSLRDTATGAGISPGHLSEIENGNSHASLPVLLRLCRALHLPIAELLPRLGGRRIRESLVTADRPGAQRVSHPELELRIDRVVLAPGGEHLDAVDDGDDVFVFVVSGSCHVEIAGVAYELAARDGMDVERASRIAVSSSGGGTVLLVRAGRR
jgi:transcriptional regulator with XRE-family HTH domain